MKQLRTIKFNLQNDTFVFIFLILVVLLMFMPLFNTFNDLLTRIVMNLDVYRYIQNYVVPWEVRIVGVLLYPFGFQPRVVGEYLAIGREDPLLIEIAWNCIGWVAKRTFLSHDRLGWVSR